MPNGIRANGAAFDDRGARMRSHSPITVPLGGPSGSLGSLGGQPQPAGGVASAFEDIGRRVRPSVDAKLRAVLDDAVTQARSLGGPVEAIVDALRSLSLR